MEFKGSVTEAQRQVQLEKDHEEFKKDIQKRKQEIKKATTVNISSDKFVVQNDFIEDDLKQKTVGLVKLDDFLRIQQSLSKKDDSAADSAKDTKKKKPKKRTLGLSFEDPDITESTSSTSTPKTTTTTTTDEQTTKKSKLKKDPTVDTSFLPDKQRETEELILKKELKQQWLAEQEKIKNERILITFSYWDGSGHRSQIEVKKGDSIANFLEGCRSQFHQLRGVNVDNLMYIKEDLIIPHHYTFYDFIISKARGKSGPLFSFDVHDDVRLLLDASKETEESHAGKVVERNWYEKNKHIFPASRWEVFDPQKSYGKYTINDKNKKN